MSINKYTCFLFSVVLVITSACVEPYTPPASKNIPDILVIDGFLNSTEGSVAVTLTKAMNLSDTGAPPLVEDATIYLEDSNAGQLMLNYQSNGRYELTGLSVNHNNEYRIRVVTDSNKEYVSDFITLKTTPEIDSVTWAPVDDSGVEIKVNSHDDTGNSRYYLWTFEEIYQYRSAYSSPYLIIDGVPKSRTPSEEVYNCWATNLSTKILIGSTVRLSRDIVSQVPLQFLEAGGKELSVHYSVMVKQTAISATAYDFYENLRKTTEDLGSLFDPQPGIVLGNVHRTGDAGERVLGIFNGGEVKEKQLFIKYGELPSNLRNPIRYECRLDSIDVDQVSELNTFNYNLVGAIVEGPTLIGYTYSTIPCTDCRAQGGTTVKPDFWP
jgi:hypothetical protein